jgi:hypothetical protein
MEVTDAPAVGEPSASFLEVQVNRFIPADFVFRCKAIDRQCP